MSVLLEALYVSKVYRDRRGGLGSTAVPRGIRSVSLRLRTGEILGLVGESGCGKSTLAKVLVGLEQADEGTLTIEDRSLFGTGMQAVPLGQRPIQMVFQDPYGSLNPRMRVRDIIGEGLRIEGRLPRGQILEEVQNQLKLVGLEANVLGKYPHEFSGGQRQRICIARALILKPKVLIADEAVSALDVSVQMQILNLLLDLRERLGLSIIFISHDMSVIEYLCDRVVVMYAGRIIEENLASTLLDAPRHPYTAHLCAARPGREAQRIGPAQPGPVDPSAGRDVYRGGCVYAPRCRLADAHCDAVEPALERSGDAAFACFHPLADATDVALSDQSQRADGG